MTVKQLMEEPFQRLKARIDPVVYQDKLDSRNQTIGGAEVPDPTPVAPPVGYTRQPSLVEKIRALVRSEALRQAAEAEGNESFDEADDFDVGEEADLRSGYEFEEVFEPPVAPAVPVAPTAPPEGSDGVGPGGAVPPTGGSSAS